MYNQPVKPFKALLVMPFVMFLGACAAPGYSPVVEDLSVPARFSERLPAPTINQPANAPLTSQPPAAAVVAKPLPYLAPKAAVTVTAQPIAKPVVQSNPKPTFTPTPKPVPKPALKLIATPAEVPAVIPTVQELPLPASDQQVVEQLLAEADQLKAQGKVTQAVIQLQRAQRIAPREPKVYARLAALQLSLGKASRAEQLALKGLTLVPNKNGYQYYFWKLIGASRSHLGDSQGEAKAIAQADKYK